MTHCPKLQESLFDLYFDHILAKEWDRFHPKPLDEFVDEFYETKLEDEALYSQKFKFMISKMKEKNWLYQYQFEYGLMKACKGVSSRISFPNVLDTAHRVFKTYEKDIEKAFFAFMEEAIPHHKDFIDKL